MKRSGKFLLFFGLLAACLATFFLLTAKPKVVDPSDPRFDPDKFSFNDYKYRDERIAAYKKLFPQGTPKADVDRVLVKAGGADCGPRKEVPGFFYCREPNRNNGGKLPCYFTMRFNKEQKLINIYLSGVVGIYPWKAEDYEWVRKYYKKGRLIK